MDSHPRLTDVRNLWLQPSVSLGSLRLLSSGDDTSLSRIDKGFDANPK